MSPAPRARRAQKTRPAAQPASASAQGETQDRRWKVAAPTSASKKARCTPSRTNRRRATPGSSPRRCVRSHWYTVAPCAAALGLRLEKCLLSRNIDFGRLWTTRVHTARSALHHAGAERSRCHHVSQNAREAGRDRRGGRAAAPGCPRGPAVPAARKISPADSRRRAAARLFRRRWRGGHEESLPDLARDTQATQHASQRRAGARDALRPEGREEGRATRVAVVLAVSPARLRRRIHRRGDIPRAASV
jgi:hypothetical protein